MSTQPPLPHEKALQALGLHLKPGVSFAPDDQVPTPPELGALCAQRVALPAPRAGTQESGYARLKRVFAKDHAGLPEILWWHAVLAELLCRQSAPQWAVEQFLRLWHEQHEFIAPRLDPAGLCQALALFTALSNETTDRAYARDCWQALKSAATLPARPKHTTPALHSLTEQIWRVRDDAFRAQQTLTTHIPAQKAAPDRFSRAQGWPAPLPARIQTNPAQLRWGTVSLIKAPFEDIARFAAHHIGLGAARVHIYLDAPMPTSDLAFLRRHPALRITTCDADWWSRQKTPRMQAHQMRQAYVATQCYRRSTLDWLAHIDVDEFLLPPGNLAEILAQTPPDQAAILAPPAEQLTPMAGAARGALAQFKLTPRDAGQPKSTLETLYPTFGAYLRGGFISHTEGKLIARTGVPQARFGLHALHHQRRPITNKQSHAGLFLGHAHACDLGHFQRMMRFRLDKGSYRKSRNDQMGLRDILQLLQQESGDDGITRFYQEVCTARPELIAALRAHDMLLERPLAQPDQIAEYFGERA